MNADDTKLIATAQAEKPGPQIETIATFKIVPMIGYLRSSAPNFPKKPFPPHPMKQYPLGSVKFTGELPT